jgi:4'-phosphopantetheinyl transferase
MPGCTSSPLMDCSTLPVLPWSGPHRISSAVLQADAAPLVLAIETPETSIRDAARALARAALREAFGVLLGRSPETVPLLARPGYPIVLDIPGLHAGISVSHEPGLTIAAIRLGGAVGVDLMRVDTRPDWLPDWEALACDYLGPHVAERIARRVPADRARSFAREWTRLEASLKCLAMPLQEWCPALERKLTCCCLFDLDVPEGFIGSLAVC